MRPLTFYNIEVLMRRFCWVRLLPVLLLAAVSQAAPPKELKWLNNYDLATSLAHKEDKVILAYFSGSDWDPWCQKLDNEVLSTPMFREWARQNVIPLQIDFPRERQLASTVRAQNEKLKTRYSVSKVPTFIFFDSYGQPFARAGYDDLRLREEEHKGEPRAAIEYLNGVLKTRPKEEKLVRQPEFATAYRFAKDHYQTLVLLITHAAPERVVSDTEELLKNQRLIKFLNRSVVFAEVNWPDASDLSPNAEAFRGFAARHKLSQMPIQLVIWERPDNVLSRMSALDVNHVDELIAHIQKFLPHIDYTSGWLTDFAKAQTIAAQQQRYIFLAFTSMDSGEWSKKMDDEIFQSEQFKTYARKNLVLVRVDFPTASTQPAAVATQNKTLAEMYNVRGYPTVIVLNPLSQRVVDARYMKGGPTVFLSELGAVIEKDRDRRASLKD